MCLITKQQKPFIAKRDMVVYKELTKINDETAKSLYNPHVYTIGELYKTDIKEVFRDFVNICCYDEKDNDYLDKKYPGWRSDINHGSSEYNLKCFGEGFHSVNKSSRLTDVDYTIYECIIPKGSEYYREPTGCIVSNQIIINKILE